MPKALGRLEQKIVSKFPPRIQRFWEAYHQTVKVALFVMLFVAVAIIGVEARHASDSADKANREVRVFRQESPCTPLKPGGPPRDPKKCAINYAAGFGTLTPLQSCEFLQKGAGLITIGGEPIPPVTCKVPVKTQESREDGTAGSNNKLGNQSTDNESNGTGTNPGGGHQPSSQSPSGGQGGSGVGNPESPPSSPPVSPPDSSGGATGGSGSTPANPPVATNPATKSGLEEALGGVGTTVTEAKKGLCEINLAGIRVCVP